MLLRLPFTGSYDWPLALRMMAAHAVPGVERPDPAAGSLARVLPGQLGPLAVTVRAHRDHVSVHADGGQVPVTDVDAVEVGRRARHWLDLDLDPAPVLARFASDTILGPLVRQRPGLRRIGYPVAFEAVVSTVLGQQVSLAAARTFAGRLVATYGPPSHAAVTAFPSPERVAGAAIPRLRSALGVTGARARTVHAVAEHFATTGDWPVPVPPSDWDSRSSELLALPGIGPWTVSYLRMRLFGDPDAVPAGDLVLRRALGVATAREVLAAAEPWRPDRTYAVCQLWASTAW